MYLSSHDRNICGLYCEPTESVHIPIVCGLAVDFSHIKAPAVHRFLSASHFSECSERITTRASIEQSESGHESDGPSNAHSNSVPRQQYAADRTNNSLGEVSADRETHQWTFPTTSNTVYSSSEDDSIGADPQCSSRERSKPKDKLRSNNLSRKAGSCSIAPPETVSTHQNATTENGTAQQASSDSKSQNHSVRVHNPPSSKALDPRGEDYESDEDTEQLLNKSYQSDKPLYIPELKREASLQAERHNRVREGESSPILVSELSNVSRRLPLITLRCESTDSF
ncbi:hypothetical protein FGIG_11698 [Fasciola gigantica]|uniref:Uncharacterized protein n=1 Tax=Fasciola gigantica TaxID=46835 RepID=A0A504YFY2_FASGI|nr:hypothetical protein FGIG_11698 [Fasciola gigantica]